MTRREIVGIKRLANSASGNPRYKLSFHDGSTATTKSDSDYAYDIGNPGFRAGDTVEVEFTEFGQIARISAASVAS